MRFGNGKLVQQLFAGKDVIHRLAAHTMQRGRGVFDVIFNLIKRERIDRGFVPIGFAVHVREGKTDLFGVVAPMGPFG